jgi:phosphohistidine phosphatase
MTRLYVLRHAKAAPAVPAMRDFDRPLEALGQIASNNLGVQMAHKGVALDTIICSPSLRTRQTLEGVALHFKKTVPTFFDPTLYTEEWDGYLEIINKAHSASTLMIVGHNPSCEDIAHQLVGSGEKRALRSLMDGFAPGTLAVIDFEVSFADVAPRMGYLESLWLDGCVKR